MRAVAGFAALLLATPKRSGAVGSFAMIAERNGRRFVACASCKTAR